MGFWRKEQITILLTTKCNLNCFYCYMPKIIVAPEDQVIDLEFARVGIKDYFDSGKRKAIRYFSPGEPTLAFKEIQELTSYARTLTKEKIEIEIQTNGFFSDNVLTWIADNVDIIWVSIDGEPQTHNKQRPTTIPHIQSSHRIVNNINSLVKHPKMQVGVRATIAPENFYKQIEMVDYFSSLGVKHISSSPIYSSKLNSKVKASSLIDYAKGFVPAHHHATSLGIFYQNLFMVNFDEEVEIYCQAMSPTPRLTPDGYVSCCDWAALGPKYISSSILNNLIIGKYDGESKTIEYFHKNIDYLKSRNVYSLSRGPCKGCRALMHCAGGCVGKVASITENLHAIDENWCDAMLFLFDKLHPIQLPVFNP